LLDKQDQVSKQLAQHILEKEELNNKK